MGVIDRGEQDSLAVLSLLHGSPQAFGLWHERTPDIDIQTRSGNSVRPSRIHPEVDKMPSLLSAGFP